MKIYELKENDHFMYLGDEFVFNRIDGMYANVTKVKDDEPMAIHVGVEVEVKNASMDT